MAAPFAKRGMGGMKGRDGFAAASDVPMGERSLKFGPLLDAPRRLQLRPRPPAPRRARRAQAPREIGRDMTAR